MWPRSRGYMTERIAASAGSVYRPAGGFPDLGNAAGAYDDANFCRAAQSYRFSCPSASGLAIFKGNETKGGRHLILPPGYAPTP
jgi:hypothetical protein